MSTVEGTVFGIRIIRRIMYKKIIFVHKHHVRQILDEYSTFCDSAYVFLMLK